ncbi:NAD+ synthase [Candidatus Woesearchaeota archaeon]|nr:NAD+ synthase [Candidatus Woesearchaeota archaeon]MBT5273057.1 NAD+ synthase [Candidatus Woesearchaeota archaeon]MBT6040807.1 NAD+ synthase [Candidatus Woesearchaeota archaeon]MBT6337628.1 NAD+ synthase [Candidatus Woesearchaeota archaeon]
MNHEEITKKIVSQIQDYFNKSNITKAVIGLSGGIDSTLAAKLCILALGKENVIGVLMPEIGLSKQQNIDDAREFAEKEDIKYLLQPINKMLDSYDLNIPINELAKTNLKPRIRANILFSYANTFNALVIGTANKSEVMVGYGTKYGDLACDLFVIGDLYKTEVFALSKHLKIPENIITKVPTAELIEGQTDEQELGITYEKLDQQLINRQLSKDVVERVRKNEHKRKYPFMVKVRDN